MNDVKVIKWNKKEKPNIEAVKKQLIKEGLQPYIFESYPNDFYGNHEHEHDEIRIILKGKMIFGIKNKEIELNKGDRLELKKGTVHWAKNNGKEKAVVLSASRH